MGIFTRDVPRDEDGAFKAQPYSARRPITAAAVRVNISDKREVESLRKRRAADTWQEDAYDYFDLIGQIKYAAYLVSNVTSRVRLYVGFVTDDDVAPSHIKDLPDIDDDLKAACRKAMTLLSSGPGGIAGLLADAALNLFITGECYLVQHPARPGSHIPEMWQIRSVDEVVATSGRNSAVKIRERRDDQPKDYIDLPASAFCGRIWRMHPRFSGEADSSLRGILEDCEEHLLLNKSARGSTKSSLNAGFLLMPDTLSNLSQADGEENDDPDIMAPLSEDESDSFEEEMMQSMLTPISDEGSASSVVPTIIRGPAEALKEIRHISLERPQDNARIVRAAEVLDRILSSLDLPKDVVNGMASVKYSNAITIEDQLYKAHIEPLALLIVDSLTVVFLRPVLRAYGFAEEDIERIVIWYDPSAITSAPSKSEAADTGYEMGVINAQAWRRAHGFSESDAPTELQMAQRLAVDRGLLSEPVTEALLRTLIPELLKEVRDAAQSNSPGAAVLDQVLDSENIPQPGEQTEQQDAPPVPSEDEPREDGPPFPLLEPGE